MSQSPTMVSNIKHNNGEHHDREIHAKDLTIKNRVQQTNSINRLKNNDWNDIFGAHTNFDFRDS